MMANREAYILAGVLAFLIMLGVGGGIVAAVVR